MTGTPAGGMRDGTSSTAMGTAMIGIRGSILASVPATNITIVDAPMVDILAAEHAITFHESAW